MSQGQYNATAPTLTDGKSGELQLDSRGALRVAIMDTGGTAAGVIQNPSVDGITPASGSIPGFGVRAVNYIFNGTSIDREVKPNTTARLLSAAASTNATSVKASAGNVFKIVGVNANAAARFLKLYNKASAPTVGTDTPVWTEYLPPSTVNGGKFELNFGAQPLYFSLGIGYGLTTAAADGDVGALTAADVVAMNIAYA